MLERYAMKRYAASISAASLLFKLRVRPVLVALRCVWYFLILTHFLSCPATAPRRMAGCAFHLFPIGSIPSR